MKNCFNSIYWNIVDTQNKDAELPDLPTEIEQTVEDRSLFRDENE